MPENVTARAKKILAGRGEVCLAIPRNQNVSLAAVTEMLDIDRISDDTLFVYANSKGFEQFLTLSLEYSILPAPSQLLDHQPKKEKLRNNWDFYPSWQVYLEIMQEFAQNHPQICRLDTIGFSENGKEILAVKIASDPSLNQHKPSVYLTSTIHGDETTGYILMLRMIDYLLTNYGVDNQVNEIIDNSIVYINPLANPDGTYAGGDLNVNGATRYNANFVDLNRNFPDAQFGNHPDNNPWQAETEAQIEFMLSNRIHLAMNIHGGAEVVNYPWDVWPGFHADNDWYEAISRAFADTVHAYAPAGWGSYLSFLNNGITNGYAWYMLTGGRQDFTNYYAHGREVTYEISLVKMPSGADLPFFWEANYRSMLQYMELVQRGFSGTVSDAVTAEAVSAKIELQGFDFDHSEVYSSPITGFYTRQVHPGSYSILCSAEGYHPKLIVNQEINWGDNIQIDFSLEKISNAIVSEDAGKIRVFPNPASDLIMIESEGLPMPADGGIFTAEGRLVQAFRLNSSRQSLQIDLPAGFYIIKIGKNKTKLTVF
jgi:hypothetical protein